MGESESNGRAEASIKIVRQYTRIYMDQLQMNTRKGFAPNHVIRQWAVRWGAMAPSRYLRGKDKKTPYQRRTGRAFTQPLCMFGESIFYKQLGSNDTGDPQWHDGIWVGTSSGSNEHIVATDHGVVRAFAVR